MNAALAMIEAVKPKNEIESGAGHPDGSEPVFRHDCSVEDGSGLWVRTACSGFRNGGSAALAGLCHPSGDPSASEEQRVAGREGGTRSYRRGRPGRRWSSQYLTVTMASSAHTPASVIDEFPETRASRGPQKVQCAMFGDRRWPTDRVFRSPAAGFVEPDRRMEPYFVRPQPDHRHSHRHAEAHQPKPTAIDNPDVFRDGLQDVDRRVGHLGTYLSFSGAPPPQPRIRDTYRPETTANAASAKRA
jgi:hypothetical protein